MRRIGKLMAADRPLPNTPIGKTMQYRLVVLEEKLLRGKRLVMGNIVDQLQEYLTDGIQPSRQHDQL